MTEKKRFILGAGGMAKEILSYYKDAGLIGSIHGFIEQQSSRRRTTYKGVLIIDENEMPKAEEGISLIGGIGNPIRYKWLSDLQNRGYCFEKLIHKNTYIGDNVIIGMGSVICPNVTLTNDVVLGDHCIVNVNSSISHDCIIGDCVTISPGASIGGKVHIGNHSWIGIGSTIIQNVKIGARVFIAAGAVVVNDIPDDSLVVGVPGKVIRKLDSDSWKNII